MRGETKIRTEHRARTAVIYVRQSTLAQVRDHTESTARQYALADEAVRLGWPRSQVEVIDADLGLSGRSADHRSGFKDLVSRVCLGEVGAIFGLEVSRLARSSADLSRLLELARLTDTLVIDSDGIYDLANFNDRLLLGLKGTMSEAELHLLAGRLQGAKRAAAERGDLRTPLPVGYCRDEEGEVIVDPDEEVSGAVAEVFATFTQVGSAYAVVGALAKRRFPRRAYGGAWAGQLRFGSLTHSRVCSILSNPVYAGAYVYGRFRSKRTVTPDGGVHTSTVELPRAQWAVCIHDHHLGYISWASFLAGEAKLAANATNTGARPPREGSALCQGIVICGSCGRPMSTRYAGAQPYYECARARADHVATPDCRSVRAATVDDPVAAALLDAVTPEQLALTLATARHAQIPLPAPGELAAAVGELPRLWSAPSTAERDRKRLLRTLLGDVTLRPGGTARELRVGLRWNSGAAHEVVVQRMRPVTQWRRAAPAAVALARQVGPSLTNPELAAALNAAGHTTGTGKPFDTTGACNLRYAYKIGSPDLLALGELTPRGVAERLEISMSTVHAWLAAGTLPARRSPTGRWCICL